MDFTINAITHDDINEFDIFNYNHNSEDDYDQFEYNCMAYAFNAYQWLNPIDLQFEELDDLIREAGISSKKQKRKFSEAYDMENFNNHYMRKIIVSRLLKAFPKLRVINSFNELKENEYGISFATSSEDYHFIRFEDNKFSHKMGERLIEEITNDIDGFKDYGYDSKILRFAMPKGDTEFKETV